MNKSMVIVCLQLGMLALSGNAIAAQAGGPPGLSGLLPNINLGPKSVGMVPPPFVVPRVPAVLPSSPRVDIPSKNPIGNTVNSPGLLRTANVPTVPPSVPPSPTGVPPGASGGAAENGAGVPDHMLLAGQPTIESRHTDSAQLPGESEDYRNLPTCK